MKSTRSFEIDVDIDTFMVFVDVTFNRFLKSAASISNHTYNQTVAKEQAITLLKKLNNYVGESRISALILCCVVKYILFHLNKLHSTETSYQIELENDFMNESKNLMDEILKLGKKSLHLTLLLQRYLLFIFAETNRVTEKQIAENDYTLLDKRKDVLERCKNDKTFSEQYESLFLFHFHTYSFNISLIKTRIVNPELLQKYQNRGPMKAAITVIKRALAKDTESKILGPLYHCLKLFDYYYTFEQLRLEEKVYPDKTLELKDIKEINFIAHLDYMNILTFIKEFINQTSAEELSDSIYLIPELKLKRGIHTTLIQLFFEFTLNLSLYFELRFNYQFKSLEKDLTFLNQNLFKILSLTTFQLQLLKCLDSFYEIPIVKSLYENTIKVCFPCLSLTIFEIEGRKKMIENRMNALTDQTRDLFQLEKRQSRSKSLKESKLKTSELTPKTEDETVQKPLSLTAKEGKADKLVVESEFEKKKKFISNCTSLGKYQAALKAAYTLLKSTKQLSEKVDIHMTIGDICDIELARKFFSPSDKLAKYIEQKEAYERCLEAIKNFCSNSKNDKQKKIIFKNLQEFVHAKISQINSDIIAHKSAALEKTKPEPKQVTKRASRKNRKKKTVAKIKKESEIILPEIKSISPVAIIPEIATQQDTKPLTKMVLSHHITDNQLPAYLLRILGDIASLGYQVYIFGETLSDLLLENKAHAYDLITNAPREKIAHLFYQKGDFINEFSSFVINCYFESVHLQFFNRPLTATLDEALLDEAIINLMSNQIENGAFTCDTLFAKLTSEGLVVLDGTGGYTDLKNNNLVFAGNISKKLAHCPATIFRIAELQAKYNNDSSLKKIASSDIPLLKCIDPVFAHTQITRLLRTKYGLGIVDNLIKNSVLQTFYSWDYQETGLYHQCLKLLLTSMDKRNYLFLWALLSHSLIAKIVDHHKENPAILFDNYRKYFSNAFNEVGIPVDIQAQMANIFLVHFSELNNWQLLLNRKYITHYQIVIGSAFTDLVAASMQLMEVKELARKKLPFPNQLTFKQHANFISYELNKLGYMLFFRSINNKLQIFANELKEKITNSYTNESIISLMKELILPFENEFAFDIEIEVLSSLQIVFKNSEDMLKVYGFLVKYIEQNKAPKLETLPPSHYASSVIGEYVSEEDHRLQPLESMPESETVIQPSQSSEKLTSLRDKYMLAEGKEQRARKPGFFESAEYSQETTKKEEADASLTSPIYEEIKILTRP